MSYWVWFRGIDKFHVGAQAFGVFITHVTSLQPRPRPQPQSSLASLTSVLLTVQIWSNTAARQLCRYRQAVNNHTIRYEWYDTSLTWTKKPSVVLFCTATSGHVMRNLLSDLDLWIWQPWRRDIPHPACITTSQSPSFCALTMVYSHFPDNYFPGWFFSRKDVSGKTIPGWSLSRKDVSRVVVFPDETLPVCYVWWLGAKVYLSRPMCRWKFLWMNGKLSLVQDKSDKINILVIFPSNLTRYMSYMLKSLR